MAATEKLRVLHVITGLGSGGAETTLFSLLSRLNRARFETEVVSLTDAGVVGPRIQELGIPVREVGMARGMPSLRGLLQLSRHMRRFHPQVVHSWMYHANLATAAAAAIGPRPKLIWSIRHGELDPKHQKRMTIWTAKVGALLSRSVPTYIVCPSDSVRRCHLPIGYASHRMRVIVNGFNTEKFHPDEAARRDLRRELGLSADMLLVGVIARFHSQKGHQDFIEAARILARKRPGIRFVLCGSAVTRDNAPLSAWIDQAGLREYFHLLGERSDIPRIAAALDVVASPSLTEGFPNAVAEAMACGTPCAVTNVGESAQVVGDTGIVVPPKEPRLLAEACEQILALPAESRRHLGLQARRRIEALFSLEATVAQYAALYETAAGKGCF
jgi:glycosyltransferase involved in cell wall biosynthesis